MLEGIKVVELGTHIAIPNAARTLADWGADVIKVESPKGDAWRVVGNAYGVPYSPDCNPIFQVPNGNKRSIAIDLKSAEGREVMLKLLSEADVFLTNTRPKGLAKLGLDYETLKEKFPRLIYLHFSGYGPEGPDKDKPGYDIAAYWSKAGMPIEWALKESGPIRPLPGFGDSTLGVISLAAVLGALLNREKTGKGDFISTSLYSGALWFNSCGLISAQFQEATYPRSRYSQPTLYHVVYRTKDDDYFTFSATNWDNMYDKLLEKVGLTQYVNDPRFQTLAGGRGHLQEIVPIFDAVFAEMSTKDVVRIFAELDVVCEVMTNPKNVVTDEQAWANDYLETVELENGDKVVLPKSPIRFTNAKTKAFSKAPMLGAHSADVLRELGYEAEAIEDLIQRKVIIE